MDEPTLTFPEGLIGCPEWRRFRVETPPGSALRYLVSLDSEGVVFSIYPARRVLADFKVDPYEEDRARVPAAYEAWVTLRASPLGTVANLKGPLLIEPGWTTGQQVANRHYSEQYPVAPAGGEQ